MAVVKTVYLIEGVLYRLQSRKESIGKCLQLVCEKESYSSSQLRHPKIVK